MKKASYYSTYCVLAGAVLYYAWDLSSSGRGLIDLAVLTLIASALLYNLFRLARRLHAAGGTGALWHLLRTLLFWVIGLLNTLFRAPEDSESWRYLLGWLFIVLAAADSVALHMRERRVLRDAEQSD